ncbi:unknown [Acinetobacter sp. CAG:196]|nr:unknown [Acinetobacter sp. CAG:196]
MNTILSILNSPYVGNIILLISAIIAIRTYKEDIKQKKLLNTLDFISCFLEGNWISDEDKKNWNEFFEEMLVRNSCGKFSLTGKYITLVNVNNGLSSEEELIQEDIISIFSEGKDAKYGKSLINILNLLEFIAQKVNNKELDYNLIKIRLLRFYQLANYYNDILYKSEDENKAFYPEVKKLFKKLSKAFGKNEPFGEYCIFPV